MEFQQNLDLCDPITKKPYDLVSHIPYILPCCGETCALTTINKIKSENGICPFCNDALPDSGFIKNKIVCKALQPQENQEKSPSLSQKNASSTKRQCAAHPNREASIFCYEDNTVICFQCLHEQTHHTGHQIEDMQVCLEQLKTKLNEVQPKLNKVRSDLVKILEKVFKELTTLVQQKLDEKITKADRLIGEVTRFQASNTVKCNFGVREANNFCKAIQANDLSSKLDTIEKQMKTLIEGYLSDILDVKDNNLKPENQQKMNMPQKEVSYLQGKVLVIDNNDELRGLIQVLKGEQTQISQGKAKPSIVLPTHYNYQRLEFRNRDNIGLKGLSKPELRQIEWIYVNKGQLGEQGANLLALKELKNLIGLSLDSNQLGSQGVIRLLESQLTNLEVLCLCRNNIDHKGAQALALSNLPRLTKIMLDDNPIGNAGLAAFAQSTLFNLKELWAYNTQVSDEGAEAIAKSNLVQLKVLALDYNKVSDKGLIALAQGKLINLERLSFTDNNISDVGVEVLARSKLSRLAKLGLDGNHIGDRGALALAEFNKTTLKELYLNNNRQITVKGAKPLMNSGRFEVLTFCDYLYGM